MKRSLLVIIICVLLLTGCNNKNENNIDKDKILTEIDYFSESIANMLNNLNNISLDNYELVSEKVSINSSDSRDSNQSSSGSSSSQDEAKESKSSTQVEEQETSSVTVTELRNNSVLNIDTETVNWDFMRNEIEKMNNSWNVIMIDLYNNKVSNDDVLAVGDLLNKTILSIKNEDKSGTLVNLSSLYVYMPKFLSAISAENSKQNIESTKSHIYIAYTAASVNDWDSAIASASNAENTFLNVLNNTEYTKNKEHKVNMTYMLIKDLQISAASNERSLFFLKYKNLVESINQLT